MKKITAQRKAIVKVLLNTRSHPTAEWVYDEVKKEIPGIGLATVYRTLRLLAAKGKVLELHTRQGTARYDGNTDVHYHFHCDQCGRIIDLDEPVDSTIEARIASATGLKVTRHSLEMSGLCLDCQTAPPAGTASEDRFGLHC